MNTDNIVTPQGQLLCTSDEFGSVTYIQPEILDQMAAVLWNELADHNYWGYSDEASYWEDLDELSKEALRLIVYHVLRPLLSRFGTPTP